MEGWTGQTDGRRFGGMPRAGPSDATASTWAREQSAPSSREGACPVTVRLVTQNSLMTQPPFYKKMTNGL